jgi:hypothetical protein
MARRIQLDFSDAGYEELSKLKKSTDAPTYAAVVRNALSLYRWYVEAQAEGADILLRKRGTKETERVHFVR